MARTDDDAEREQMGVTIRRLRRDGGLTLDELAQRAGVSTSLVSQIERGLAEPSLTTLRSVAAALGVPVAALFVGEVDDDAASTDRSGHRLVVRKDARKHLRMPDSPVTYELISPDLSRAMEVISTEIPGGERVPREASLHVGEETVVCISGTIFAVQEDQEWRLRPGDAISWDPARPHWLENRGQRRATVIAVITPPNF